MMDHNIMEIRSVVFIGAGNLATHLAYALYENGYEIKQVFSRTIESAMELAVTVNAEYINSIERITDQADLYITALTDEALIQLIPQLTQNREQCLWVHTAGSISMDIWKEYCSHYGVLYPLQTFSKKKAIDFHQIPLFIEGVSKKDTEHLLVLAKKISDQVYQVTSEQRKCLHLAAVFACNFTNYMYVLAANWLKEYDLPFDVLLPLIDETAKKVHSLPPREAQTGPAVRNDREVMNSHLAMLAQLPDLQHIYNEISKSILKNKEKN